MFVTVFLMNFTIQEDAFIFCEVFVINSIQLRKIKDIYIKSSLVCYLSLVFRIYAKAKFYHTTTKAT